MRRTFAASTIAFTSLVACGSDGNDLATDSTPPVVITTSIADQSNGVSEHPSVTLSLSEEIDPASAVDGRIRLIAQRVTGDPSRVLGRHPVSIDVDASGTQIEVRPLGALEPDTQYRLEVSGLEDLAGNASEPFALTVHTSARLIALEEELYSGVIDNYRKADFDGGQMQYITTYTGAGEDTQWKTSDDFISGYYAPMVMDGARFNLTINSPGNDGLWWNSDDLPIYASKQWDYDGALRTAIYIDPGINGIWFDDDDEGGQATQRLFDERGLSTRHLEYDEGADGIPFTADDQITRDVEYVHDDDYVLGSFEAQSAGVDGVFGTEDDLGIAMVRRYDDAGQLVREEFYNEVARGGFPDYPADALYKLRVSSYDGLQLRRLVRYNSLTAAGDDGILGTDDDVPSNYTMYEHDADDRIVREISYGLGADELIDSADDVILRYTDYSYTGSGAPLTVLEYPAAGADGVFFTSDDELRTRIEYLPQ